MVPLRVLIECLICLQCCIGHVAPIRAGLGYVRAGIQSIGGVCVNSEFELMCLWLEGTVL